MAKQLLISIRITVILVLIVSGIYPFVAWWLAQVAFNHQANGSLITNAQDQVIGSELLGQI